mmetsp:Transcript_17560/g.40916  ORF Transcript_17560/g.40916 Transcript_17560/m.40916 type:complete len:232 (-) Transcript_17560:440-1135(-)
MEDCATMNTQIWERLVTATNRTKENIVNSKSTRCPRAQWIVKMADIANWALRPKTIWTISMLAEMRLRSSNTASASTLGMDSSAKWLPSNVVTANAFMAASVSKHKSMAIPCTIAIVALPTRKRRVMPDSTVSTKRHNIATRVLEISMGICSVSMVGRANLILTLDAFVLRIIEDFLANTMWMKTPKTIHMLPPRTTLTIQSAPWTAMAAVNAVRASKKSRLMKKWATQNI